MAGYTLKSSVTRLGTLLGGLGISLGVSLVKNKRIYTSPKWDFIVNQRRDLIYRATKGTMEYKQSIEKMNEYLMKVAKERVAEQLAQKMAIQDLVTNLKDAEFVFGKSAIQQYLEQALKRQPPEKVLQMIVENTKLPTNLEKMGATGKIPTQALRQYIYATTKNPNLAKIIPGNKSVDETTAKILLHATQDKEFEKVVIRASSESRSTGKIFDQIAKMATKKPEIAETLIRDAAETVPLDKAFSALEKLGVDNQDILKTIVEDHYGALTKGAPNNPEISRRFQMIEKRIRESPEFEKIVNEKLVQEAGGDSPEAIIKWLKANGGDAVIQEAFTSSGLLDNMKQEVKLLNQLKEKGVISDREYEKTILRMMFGSAGASDDELITKMKSLGISVDKGIDPEKFVEDVAKLVENGTLDPADLANGSKYVDDVLKSKLGAIGMVMRTKVLPKSKTLEGVYEFGQRHPLAMSMMCGAVGQAAGTAVVFSVGQFHGIGGVKVDADRYIDVGGNITDGLWVKAKAGDRGTWVVHIGNS